MSLLGDAIGRSKRVQRGPGATASGPTSVAVPPPQVASGGQDSELRRRRDALAQQVTELHWDLGGLAYEMAIRDHFRLDVLVRRAAILQERDAELAEIERLLALEDGASTGACPACGAPHSRGAVFCWQCGATLMQRRPGGGGAAASDAGADQSTAVMDALLASDGSRREDGEGEQAASFAGE